MTGIIIMDKPRGWTSHDVVARLRGLLREKKIGHSGTLDPMATGVLPVFVGRATRAIEFVDNADKEYLAHLRLGIATDTQDITGTVLYECKQNVSESELREVLERFTGPISQLPPMYSAVKVGGKKLYELARKGIEIERRPRDIVIHKLELVGRKGEDFILRIACAKGTYVRTLCSDIGEALGCGGTLTGLRRTRAGGFTEAEAHTIEAVEKSAFEGRAAELLKPVDSLFAEHPAIYLNPAQEKKCRNGADFEVKDKPVGTYRVYGPDGEFLAIGDVSSRGLFSAIKSFFEVK
ncbi:MAG TPA: tRNA pseudouridine(55) synthase TruB [Clostridiales bacterium]|jgi:tRNA pseudouridine55 synthase|nr:tRNA pseudouridine(55) synthase TruB [Clostridiales bacterium]